MWTLVEQVTSSSGQVRAARYEQPDSKTASGLLKNKKKASSVARVAVSSILLTEACPVAAWCKQLWALLAIELHAEHLLFPPGAIWAMRHLVALFCRVLTCSTVGGGGISRSFPTKAA